MSDLIVLSGGSNVKLFELELFATGSVCKQPYLNSELHGKNHRLANFETNLLIACMRSNR